MSVVRIVFFGSPDIAVSALDALYEDDHFEIVKVVTQPDRPAGRKLKLLPCDVKKRAIELGLSVLSVENVNTSENLEILKNLRADSSVVLAFGQILKPELIDLFPKKIVNIHGSLLPRWRGAAPIQRAILQGDEVTGATLQIIVPKLDAGPIIGFRRISIESTTTSSQLYEQMKEKAAQLLHIEYMDYLRGNLSPQPQDESLVTYAKKLKKEEGLIDWNNTNLEIDRRIRGLDMWPGTWTLRDGKNLKIKEATPSDIEGEAGKVMQCDDQSFTVGCGKGSLKILRVQPESRAALSVKDYIKGYPIKTGDRFGE